MTNQTRLLGALLAAGLAISLPVAALAQQPPGKQAPAKAAPHAAPAPEPAPAPHMAPAPHAPPLPRILRRQPAWRRRAPRPPHGSQRRASRRNSMRRRTFNPRLRSIEARSNSNSARSAHVHRQNVQSTVQAQVQLARRSRTSSPSSKCSSIRVSSYAPNAHCAGPKTGNCVACLHRNARNAGSKFSNPASSVRCHANSWRSPIPCRRNQTRGRCARTAATATPRLTADAARQGRFASRFAQRNGGANWRNQI